MYLSSRIELYRYKLELLFIVDEILYFVVKLSLTVTQISYKSKRVSSFAIKPHDSVTFN